MNRLKKHYKLIVFTAVILSAVFVILMAVPSRLNGSKITPLVGKASKILSIDLSKAEKTYNNMALAAENENMKLYLDSSNGNFTVLDKKSGEYWNSNPSDNIIESNNIIGTAEKRVRSQFLLTYYNEDGLKQEFNTFEHAVSQENISVNAIEDGVAVTYKIGEADITLEMLPVVINESDYESIKSKATDDALEALESNYSKGSLEKMSESRSSRYKKLYTKLKENSQYYFLDLYAPDYAYENLYRAIFIQGGYSFNDLESTNKRLGYTGKSQEYMQISFTAEYTLEQDGIKVRLPMSELSVPESIHVTDISALPYFGAANIDEKGYIFVPDGSGGIINLNNGKTQTGELEIPIYGTDGCIAATELKSGTPVGRIPVFALKKSGKAFLAIIEQGAAQSSVNAAVSGVNTPLNQVYSSFNILPFDKMVYKTSSENVSTNLYMDEYYNGDITLMYYFFDEQESSYVSIANAYRDYLIKNGILSEKKIEHSLQISLTGQINIEKTMVGIPYSTTHTVTSFKEANEIAKVLKENNVDNLNIHFQSWFGGGLAEKMPYNVKPTKSIGGKKGLKELNDSLGEGNVSLGSGIIKIWAKFPKFNIFKFANRLVTNKSAIGYQYNYATSQILEDESTYYMLSPQYISSLTENYVKSINNLGVYCYWFTDLGSCLNSDFKSGNQVNRNEAEEYTVNALNKIPDGSTVTFTDPNAYAFKYADKILALPSSSSGSYMINHSIPFLQIVLSGCVEYSLPSLNENGSTVNNMLKCAEYGGDLYFDWIYASNESLAALDGNEVRLLSSKNYESWIDEATEYYRRLKQELYSVAQGKIIDHTEIKKDVFKTKWQNGSVIVNYSEDTVTLEGQTIPPSDFSVIKG